METRNDLDYANSQPNENQLEDIKYQLEEFELGGIDVWELIKKIETIVNK